MILLASKKLITIITVSFNASKTIEETFKSVSAQKFKDFEYIVKDGGSNDRTVELIKKYSKKGLIDRWVSKKDAGLYDAMNEGVKMAKGKYVYFLNADDTLHDANVLSDISKELLKEPDFLYGGIEFYYPEEKATAKVSRTASISELKKGNMPPHQGSFVKRKLLQQYPFDTAYRSSADFDFFCRALIGGAAGKKSNRIIAVMQMGGVSSGSVSYRETETAVKKYFGKGAFISLKLKHLLFWAAKGILGATGTMKRFRNSRKDA